MKLAPFIELYFILSVPGLLAVLLGGPGRILTKAGKIYLKVIASLIIMGVALACGFVLSFMFLVFAGKGGPSHLAWNIPMALLAEIGLFVLLLAWIIWSRILAIIGLVILVAAIGAICAITAAGGG